MERDTDIRHVLSAIHVPTLILHRVGDHWYSIEAARYMAARIAGAKLVELEGEDHLPWFGDKIDGDDVRGIAVHVVARVASLTGPSEVVVSSTVKDLVAGSGLRFADRGEHELKGVPDRWRLYAVTAADG